MAKKIDIAKEIVDEFPDENFEAEELKDSHTEEELKQLQSDLRKEAEEGSEAPVPEKVESNKYRLKDPKTQYGEGSFSLIGKQEKELPANPSSELLERIKAGYIVEVK